MVAGQAALRLGTLLADHGDKDAADDALQQAVQWGSYEALDHLARLRRMSGDQEGAGVAAKQASLVDRHDAAMEVAIRLGEDRQNRGDTAGAEKAFEIARMVGNRDRTTGGPELEQLESELDEALAHAGFARSGSRLYQVRLATQARARAVAPPTLSGLSPGEVLAGLQNAKAEITRQDAEAEKTDENAEGTKSRLGDVRGRLPRAPA